MASIYDDIRNALETQLANTSGIPDIVWENVNYNPSTGTSFVRPFLAPTTRRPAVRGLNPQQLYEGFFFVDIFVPEGNGPGAADTIADTIIESFEATSTLTANSKNVCIRYAERTADISPRDAWYQVRVSIMWYTYNT